MQYDKNVPQHSIKIHPEHDKGNFVWKNAKKVGIKLCTQT
jgi:hypothetical protein